MSSNVLAFYSNSFFSWNIPGDNMRSACWLSWGIGLCNFIFTLPAFLLIDSFGRAALLLATCPGMIVFMLVTCVVFAVAGGKVPRVAIEALVYFFTTFYSLGQGPVSFTYSPEVFPLVYREIDMSMAVSANFFGAGLLTLFVPQAQFAGKSSWADKDTDDVTRFNRSQAKMLGTSVALEPLAYFLIFCFVPETARYKSEEDDDLNHLSLEEITCIFQVPTIRHTMYRIFEALPNTARQARWLLFRSCMKEVQWPGRPVVAYRWRVNSAVPDDEEGALPPAVSTEQKSSEEHVTDNLSRARSEGPIDRNEISPATATVKQQSLELSCQSSFRVQELEQKD